MTMTFDSRAARRPRARLATWGLSIALVLTSLFTGSVAAGNNGAPAQELRNALQFRQAFGLSTDAGSVRDLVANPASDRTFSVALNPAEVAEMERRMNLQEQLGPLQAYGRANAATFGGGFIDQAAGAVIDLAFTSDVDRHRAAVESRAPEGAAIRVRHVARSEGDLNGLVTSITNNRPFFERLGVELGAVWTDIPANAVQVEVMPLTDAVGAAVSDRFGEGVTVVAGGERPALTGCSNRDNCIGPPLRAGISTTYGCTVGFLVNEDGAYRWMTAGHCAQQNYNWYHSVYNYALGYTRDERWYNNSPADVGTVGNVSAAYVSNRVYYTASSWFGMYSAQGSGSDWVGQAVCQSGRRSGYQCGTIQSRNVSVPYWDTQCGCYTTMIRQRRANYFVQVGDSGAPVINSSNTNQAVGIQSGMDGSYIAYYSQISEGLSLLNATLRTIDY